MSEQASLPDEQLDVLIIGAGLSGIGTAAYLRRKQPSKQFVILEARDNLGGTWDLFRYPGIRSDSDLYTFGYDFKPWTKEKSLADAKDILGYLRETTTEYQLEPYIRYRQRVISANWRSDQGRWEVLIEHVTSKEQRTVSCQWLFSAGGYYRYDQGFSPLFEGLERFRGQVIHPQHWPEELDYSGKKVVVIGSGATAVTIIPAMADKAAHITMLQRTPSYIINQPAKDPVARLLRKLLPEQMAHSFIRYKNAKLTLAFWRFSQRFPKLARKLLMSLTRKQLPQGYPVDTHFNPPYNPWDQRLCSVPDGDLFKSISSGKASIETGHIQTFTESGIQLKSGRELEADIIVTATGLNVQLFGGILLSKDGRPIVLNQTLAYKGMMLSGVPNFAFAIGYTNSSWTLKVCLLCDHFCRLLGYMDENSYAICEPIAPEGIETRPLLAFGAGYVQRALDSVPRQGPGEPWVMSMDYFRDIKLLRKGTVADKCLSFSMAPATRAYNKMELSRLEGEAQ
jgi:cation diffusion facilitator CzcD-associated flavoprotein CzcO